jgi:hypothetical protein
LFTGYNDSSLSGSFEPNPVAAFGVEVEPNLFEVFNMVLTTTDGATHTLTQSVNGFEGAQFFGWIGAVTSMQITCSDNCGGEGFAIGDLVVGGFAGTPGQPACHGQSVSALSKKYNGIDAAATALGFSSVQSLQDTIKAFCGS